MSLMKCPDCGNKVSENAEKCPKCGCPNNGNFIKIEKQNKSRLIIGVIAAIAVVAIAVYMSMQPSEKDSPFYNAENLTSDMVLEMYGEPDEIILDGESFEFRYETFNFIDVEGNLYFRFRGEYPSDDLSSIYWYIDETKGYKTKDLEIVCLFYDDFYGYRTGYGEDGYEWETTNSRIIFDKSPCRFRYTPR